MGCRIRINRSKDQTVCTLLDAVDGKRQEYYFAEYTEHIEFQLFFPIYAVHT